MDGLKPPHLKHLPDKPGFSWYIIDDDDKRILNIVFEASENGKTFTCLNPDKYWRSGKL